MPLQTNNWMGYSRNANPKCPHCDEVIFIAEHEIWELYKEPDESHQIECPFCYQELIVKSNCEWTFSTDNQTDL